MSLLEEPSPPAAERQAPAQRAAEPRQADPAATDGVARPRFRRLLRIGLIVALVIAAGIGGTLWWLSARDWVSTDDAFIDVHMVQISPQVAGRVARVLVKDNEEVAAGQPLLALDPADFAARLAQAVANEKSATGMLAQARAQLAVSQANRAELQSEVGVAKASAANAAIDLERDQRLSRINSAALSLQQLDNATATARSDTANLAAAQRKVVAAEAQIGYARTQIATAEAGVEAAAAQVEEARLDLSYTKLTAPAAGHIAHKNVAVGDYIQIGQALMALVPNRVWITANFKETDLAYLRVGQPVEIEVDAYPGRTLHGHIDSFQAGSGDAFSLLPPENATGNYVKIVQRVPVKIVFDDPPSAVRLLGPGMSVIPYVKIR
ncbi:MAG: HlyD family secretion protein [Stellaceae bacterium]